MANELILTESNNFIRNSINAYDIRANRLSALALAMIQQKKSEELSIEMSLSKLSKYMGHRIYDDPRNLCIQVLKESPILCIETQGEFRAKQIVTECIFDKTKNTIQIKFIDELKDYVLDLHSQYTQLEISILMSFRNNEAFILYEILKKDLYKTKYKKSVTFTITITELLQKFSFLDEKGNKKINQKWEIDDKGNPVSTIETFDERILDNYGQFNHRKLKPAINEINNKSDIQVEYTHVRNSDIIEFIFSKKELLAPELEVFVGHNELSAEDIEHFYNIAKSTNLVIQAISSADKVEQIDNYVGWIIEYIKRGGYNANSKIKTVKGSAKLAQTLDGIYENEQAAIRFMQRVKTKKNFSEFIKYIEDTEKVKYEYYETIINVLELSEKYGEYIQRRNMGAN